MRYRRLFQTGGTYFFTVVTYNREKIFENSQAVILLKKSMQYAQEKHPFTINAAVILPDHLHCIWTLPSKDSDFPTRWMLLKNHFTRHYRSADNLSAISTSREKQGEQCIWQRRYWEHLIRNEDDLKTHLDYIHYNPVKHKLTSAPKHWPYTSFHAFVKKGFYSENWGITTAPDP